ncbi:hypothetical protein FZC66_08670 [Priestia megaterium]|nr:hypothetical protein FZC66_08670 [Priestia megaterium]
MRSKKLYIEFLEVAKSLNKNLNVVPVLYGSLGLEILTGRDFVPQDVDILVPLEFIKEKWGVLKDMMENLGYTFVDLHEHEFRKENIKVAFSYIEDLQIFAQVNYADLKRVEYEGAAYQLLHLEDYVKVYTQSLKDSYRRNKNNSKDQKKLEIIYNLLKSVQK